MYMYLCNIYILLKFYVQKVIKYINHLLNYFIFIVFNTVIICIHPYDVINLFQYGLYPASTYFTCVLIKLSRRNVFKH